MLSVSLQAVVFVYCVGTNAIDFRPGGGASSVPLPIPFDVAGSHWEKLDDPSSSFWSTSFIRGPDHHDYLVASHVIPNAANKSMYRAAILDIMDSAKFSQYERLVDLTSAVSDKGTFSISFPQYRFGLTDVSDSSQLRTWSSVSETEFDLIFNLSAPLILNSELGTSLAGNETVYEWSRPASETSRWPKVNNIKFEIDSSRSLTWYDRQWGGGPPHWIWFQLYLETVNVCDDLLSCLFGIGTPRMPVKGVLVV
ncbi:hypothetical protein EDB80DRAFT_877407 [Ilyonectria destructans]|nr:hypothetical protein EDB80DRAFT_877407 [Ilyonectria destructans]